MTRARDIANLGTQAGSGLDASDITTGTMGAVTLGSTVVFPSGHVTNVFKFKDTSTATLNIQTSTITVAGVFSFSAISGRHYIVTGSQFISPYRYSGSHNRRFQTMYLYYGTTARSSLDTTVDTLMFSGGCGHYVLENSTVEAADHSVFSYNGSFTAGSTATHYVYTAVNTVGSDDRARVYSTANEPHVMNIFEVMP